MNNANLNISWYEEAHLLVSSRADSTLCCPFKAIASNGTSLAWCPIEWEVTCLTRITFCLRNIRLISSWAVLWRKNGLMIKCWIVKNILLEAAKLKAASSFWLGFNCYNIFKRLLYYSQILLIRTLRGPQKVFRLTGLACNLSKALWQHGGNRKESLQLYLWNFNSASNSLVASHRLSSQISTKQHKAETSVNTNNHWKTHESMR